MQRLVSSRTFVAILFLDLGFILGGVAESAPLLRLVMFDISVDGKKVLEASRGDSGEPGPDEVWGYLKSLDLRPRDGHVVTPDADDPLASRITGEVRIVCRYGGDVTIRGLRLLRDRADLPWRLDPAEVDRTFRLRKRP